MMKSSNINILMDLVDGRYLPRKLRLKGMFLSYK